MGRCRLCLEVDVALVDSHLLPSWVYKVLRETDPFGGPPDPIHVSGNRARSSSWQASEHLLCRSCEDRFSEWERTVRPHTFASQEAPPLLAALTSEPSRLLGEISPSVAAWSGAGVVDTANFGPFALSIFWRSAVMTVPGIRGIVLGEFTQTLREALLDRPVRMPDRMSLTMTAYDRSPVLGLRAHKHACFPVTTRTTPFHMHTFLLNGWRFDLHVGKATPDFITRMCIFSNRQVPVIIRPIDNDRLFQQMFEDHNEAVPSARLAARDEKVKRALAARRKKEEPT